MRSLAEVYFTILPKAYRKQLTTGMGKLRPLKTFYEAYIVFELLFCHARGNINLIC